MQGNSVKNSFKLTIVQCLGDVCLVTVMDKYNSCLHTAGLLCAHTSPDRALSGRGCWPRWLFTGPWSSKQTNTRARDTRITTVCGMTHRRRAEPCLMDLTWIQYFFETSHSGYLCWQYSFKVTNHIAAFGHSRLSIRISYSLPHMAKWRICIA